MLRGSTTGPGGFLANNTLWWCEPRIPMNSPNMPKFAQQSTQPSEPTEQVAKPNMRVCVRSMASGGPTPIGICLQGLLPDPEPSPRSVSGSVLVAPRTKNSKFEWFYSISADFLLSGRLDRVPVPHVSVLARFCQCKAPSYSLILLVTTVSFILKTK